MSPWLSDTVLRGQSDARLVALARGGHERAFAMIIERYRRPLLGFARRLVGEDRAEDVVQQSFVSAWGALTGGAEVDHLRGWLHGIARNTAYRAMAAPVETPLSDRMVGSAGVEAEVEGRERMRDTLAGVAALPDAQRAALVQTAFEGRSRVEIAGALGLTEGAVRQLVHRARSTLRAAATAVTPGPVVQWAAQAGPGRVASGSADRTLELVAGAGSASLAGVFAKAGAVVAVTGVVAAGVAGTGGVGGHASGGTASAATSRTLAQGTGATGSSRGAAAAGRAGENGRPANADRNRAATPGTGPGGSRYGTQPHRTPHPGAQRPGLGVDHPTGDRPGSGSPTDRSPGSRGPGTPGRGGGDSGGGQDAGHTGDGHSGDGEHGALPSGSEPGGGEPPSGGDVLGGSAEPNHPNGPDPAPPGAGGGENHGTGSAEPPAPDPPASGPRA